MPSTTDSQKGTAMDYLSAPRDSGLVKNLMSLLGYTAPTGGRLPAGVKYDTIVALNDVFASKDNDEIRSMVATRIIEYNRLVEKLPIRLVLRQKVLYLRLSQVKLTLLS